MKMDSVIWRQNFGWVIFYISSFFEEQLQSVMSNIKDIQTNTMQHLVQIILLCTGTIYAGFKLTVYRHFLMYKNVFKQFNVKAKCKQFYGILGFHCDSVCMFNV